MSDEFKTTDLQDAIETIREQQSAKDNSDETWAALQAARNQWLTAKDVAQQKLGILQKLEIRRYGEAITNERI